MSDKMNAMNGFMPMFQGMEFPMPPLPFMPMPGADSWGWPGMNEDAKKQCEDFRANLDTFWGQLRDMQKSSIEASKEQWNTFFDQYMEMQDSFIASLPDEFPVIPGIPAFLMPPISPKAFAGRMKEYTEMKNSHKVEKTDAFFDYMMQKQEYASSVANEALDNIKAKVEEKEETADAK